MFDVPKGAELFDVDGVPVLKLADGSLAFAEAPDKPFPRAAFLFKGSPATAEDLAFWAKEKASE
jgi:hypothetical protein